jgi:CDP-diacylglycerol--glycerol-3-phosphate 3-phosphatidyltransferase
LLKHIPNALTLMRLILAPVIAWNMLNAVIDRAFFIYVPEGHEVEFLRSIADDLTLVAVLFIVAALTDLFDGIAARAFNAHSKLGRIIDPIADKALVGFPLIAIALCWWNGLMPLWQIVMLATAIIVIRDVTMTVVRLRSPDGEGARVSSLAKWKTALELVVIGSFLVVSAIGAHMESDNPTKLYHLDYAQPLELIWLGALVITAALSAYTGWQYLRPAKKG